MMGLNKIVRGLHCTTVVCLYGAGYFLEVSMSDMLSMLSKLEEQGYKVLHADFANETVTLALTKSTELSLLEQELVTNMRVIDAVKSYRARINCTLADAKGVVDEFRSKHGLL